ncbi:DUF2157 domain-containing protein [Pollutibacter soli]|uniref:DUF2157 domain-containing protein n=1 Tax=Pollutibacter soli TaxID=3034157 RepID=UPI00301357B6
MPGTKLSRNLIHIISRFSNWTPVEINNAFRDNEIRATASSWRKFLEYFLSALGIGLFTAGVFFFFAYNWQDMKPFQKFGILILLIIAGIIPVFLKRTTPLVKRICLTATALLVGTLWAVFGQVYQTGADTYDYFLVWLICIAVWTLASSFPPLWLVGVFLINLTVYFYFIQDSRIWKDGAQLNILFIVNIYICILTEWLSRRKIIALKPPWFIHLVLSGALYFLTVAIISGIYSTPGMHAVISLVFGLVFFPLIFAWSIFEKSIFPLAIMGFALICILSAWIFKSFNGSAAVFLFVSLFFVAGITALIIKLVQLHKKWNIET